MPKKHKRPSRYRSPDEKRLRKAFRALIREFKLQRITEDDLIRILYSMIEDERRRVYMSLPPQFDPPVIQFDERDTVRPKVKKRIAALSQKSLIQSLSSF